MKRIHFVRSSIGAASVVLSLATLATPASAAKPAVASDAEVFAVAAATMQTGTMTKAQRAIVLSRKDLADHIIDPSRTTLTIVSTPATVQSPTGAISTAANYCAGAVGTKTYWSTTGTTVIYRFNNHTNWCYTYGSHVYSASHYHTLTNVDSATVQWNGLITDAFSNVGNYQFQSILQGRINHCFFGIRCFGTSYPLVRIEGDARGYYSVATG